MFSVHYFVYYFSAITPECSLDYFFLMSSQMVYIECHNVTMSQSNITLFVLSTMENIMGWNGRDAKTEKFTGVVSFNVHFSWDCSVH